MLREEYSREAMSIGACSKCHVTRMQQMHVSRHLSEFSPYLPVSIAASRDEFRACLCIDGFASVANQTRPPLPRSGMTLLPAPGAMSLLFVTITLP